MSSIHPEDHAAAMRYAAKAKTPAIVAAGPAFAPDRRSALAPVEVPLSSSVIDDLDARLADSGILIADGDPYAALDTPRWERLPETRSLSASATPFRPTAAPATAPSGDSLFAAESAQTPGPLLKGLDRDWVSEPALTRRNRRPGHASTQTSPPALAYADAFEIDISY